MPNPERKTADRELRALRKQLAALNAALGQALLDEPRDQSRSAHGVKVAQKGLVASVRALEQRISALVERRRELPERVPLASATFQQVMHLEQKAIVDRIKIAAYNAEEWLLERLVRHYPNSHDVRALLRSLIQVSGEMRTTPAGVLVTLDPPDNPQQRRALRGLCDDLSQLGATFPGTSLPVTYAVAMHHSELAA